MKHLLITLTLSIALFACTKSPSTKEEKQAKSISQNLESPWKPKEVIDSIHHSVIEMYARNRADSLEQIQLADSIANNMVSINRKFNWEKNGSKSILQRLKDPNIVTSSGKSLLELADSTQSYSIIPFLAQKGASPLPPIDWMNKLIIGKNQINNFIPEISVEYGPEQWGKTKSISLLAYQIGEGGWMGYGAHSGKMYFPSMAFEVKSHNMFVSAYSVESESGETFFAIWNSKGDSIIFSEFYAHNFPSYPRYKTPVEKEIKLKNGKVVLIIPLCNGDAGYGGCQFQALLLTRNNISAHKEIAYTDFGEYFSGTDTSFCNFSNGLKIEDEGTILTLTMDSAVTCYNRENEMDTISHQKTVLSPLVIDLDTLFKMK